MPKKYLLLLLCAGMLAACAGQPIATDPVLAMPTEQPPTDTPGPLDVSATPSPAPPSPTLAPLGEAAASPAATSAFEPQPGDKGLQRGNLFIEDAGIKVLQSNPAQVLLSLSGNRPTPCHQLRVDIGQPDATGTLRVQAYTVQDPNRVCIQVLKPFAEDIPLGTFPPGQYTVLVNDDLTLEFSV